MYVSRCNLSRVQTPNLKCLGASSLPAGDIEAGGHQSFLVHSCHTWPGRCCREQLTGPTRKVWFKQLQCQEMELIAITVVDLPDHNAVGQLQGFHHINYLWNEVYHYFHLRFPHQAQWSQIIFSPSYVEPVEVLEPSGRCNSFLILRKCLPQF